METLRNLVHARDLRALDVVRTAAWRLDMLAPVSWCLWRTPNENPDEGAAVAQEKK